jgi:2-keto-4-pentenoate hydratase
MAEMLGSNPAGVSASLVVPECLEARHITEPTVDALLDAFFVAVGQRERAVLVLVTGPDADPTVVLKNDLAALAEKRFHAMPAPQVAPGSGQANGV